jgi:L-threonylcarbamoyladenylate synthase
MPIEYRPALDCLKRGEFVLLPTDTGWSLAADARSEEATRRLSALAPTAERTLLISEVGQLSQYVAQVPEVAWDWVEFSEKPLTIVYPAGKNLPPDAKTPDGEVAIRLVRDPLVRDLIHRFGRAVLALPAGAGTSPDEAMKGAAEFVLFPPAVPRFLPPGPLVRLGVNGEVVFLRK